MWCFNRYWECPLLTENGFHMHNIFQKCIEYYVGGENYVPRTFSKSSFIVMLKCMISIAFFKRAFWKCPWYVFFPVHIVFYTFLKHIMHMKSILCNQGKLSVPIKTSYDKLIELHWRKNTFLLVFEKWYSDDISEYSENYEKCSFSRTFWFSNPTRGAAVSAMLMVEGFKSTA